MTIVWPDGLAIVPLFIHGWRTLHRSSRMFTAYLLWARPSPEFWAPWDESDVWCSLSGSYVHVWLVGTKAFRHDLFGMSKVGSNL